jgi:dihydrolipoamide dehydrogenase
MVDQQVAKEALRQLVKQGLDIRLGAKVLSAKAGQKDVRVEFELDGKKQTEVFDKLIVAVGRRPYTKDLGCEAAGVALDEKGYVKTDAHYRTTAQGIYAIGDVIARGPMLAHKGIEEGVVLAEQLAGHKSEVNYRAIPAVIYTAPEIAWVGLSEEQAKAQGYEVKSGSSPFAANGRARAMEATAGLVKFISDAKTDRVLGVHMVGPYVSELVSEAVTAMEYGATTEDIQLTMHAHPTLSETVHEAALAVDGHAIHSANKRKA